MLTKFKREGHQVCFCNNLDLWGMSCDRAFLSGLFTWDLPGLCRDVNLLKENGVEIEIGGPAATAMPQYVVQQTGILPHVGLDERFEHVDGKFFSVFSSRGCPHNCEFCIVPTLEGRKMIEYDSFPIPIGNNPYLCDNNILATSWAHQQLVVQKLKNVKNLDCNSGFDCRIFAHNPEKYWQLYNELHLERWRFAYDQPSQKEPVKASIEFLRSKGVRYSEISVFCLIGFPGQTFEHCVEKLQFLVDIGCSPYAMRFKPIDTIKKDYTPPEWNKGDLDLLFSYYSVPWHWRSFPWAEFKKRLRK